MKVIRILIASILTVFTAIAVNWVVNFLVGSDGDIDSMFIIVLDKWYHAYLLDPSWDVSSSILIDVIVGIFRVIAIVLVFIFFILILIGLITLLLFMLPFFLVAGLASVWLAIVFYFCFITFMYYKFSYDLYPSDSFDPLKKLDKLISTIGVIVSALMIIGFLVNFIADLGLLRSFIVAILMALPVVTAQKWLVARISKGSSEELGLPTKRIMLACVWIVTVALNVVLEGWVTEQIENREQQSAVTNP